MMDYSYEYAMEGGIGFAILWLLYMILAFGLSIAGYVLRSLGVYTIAKRREINNPWFAWIPVVDHYLLGCISDQYQYVARGKVRNKRKVLLGLNIAMAVIAGIFFGTYIAVMSRMVGAVMNGVPESAMVDDLVQNMMGPLAVIGALSMPMMILSLVTTVFRYIALYDLYTSCNPRNSAVFLALSIIFNVTEPFFIFFNRKREDGMPPRKANTTVQSAPAIAEAAEFRPEPETATEPETVVEPETAAEPEIAVEFENVTETEPETDEFVAFTPPAAPDITASWEAPTEFEAWDADDET